MTIIKSITLRTFFSVLRKPPHVNIMSTYINLRTPELKSLMKSYKFHHKLSSVSKHFSAFVLNSVDWNTIQNALN